MPANTRGWTCLKPGSGVRGLLVLERDGVADRRAVDFLDSGDDEAHIAGPSSRAGTGLRREAAELVDLVRRGPST